HGTVCAALGTHPSRHTDAIWYRHANGKRTRLGAVSDADHVSDTAFRRFLSGCSISRRRFLHCLASACRYGSDRECLLRIFTQALPPGDFRRLKLAHEIGERSTAVRSAARTRVVLFKTLRVALNKPHCRRELQIALGYCSDRRASTHAAGQSLSRQIF